MNKDRESLAMYGAVETRVKQSEDPLLFEQCGVSQYF